MKLKTLAADLQKLVDMGYGSMDVYATAPESDLPYVQSLQNVLVYLSDTDYQGSADRTGVYIRGKSTKFYAPKFNH